MRNSNLDTVDLSNFIFTADFHIKDNYNLKKVIKAVENVFEYAKANSIPTVIVAGDIFDMARPTSKEQEVLSELLSKYLPFLHIVLMPGNHDMSNKNTYSFSYLRDLSILLPSLVIIDQYTVISQIGTNYIFIPPLLKSQKGIGQSLKSLYSDYIQGNEKPTVGKNVIISHFPICDAIIADDYHIIGSDILNVEILYEFFPGAMWLLGDIHKPQAITFMDSSVHYPGSPECISFAEKNDKKGFIHYDGIPNFVVHDTIPVHEVVLKEPVNELFLSSDIFNTLLEEHKDFILKLKVSVLQYDVGNWISILRGKFQNSCYMFRLEVNIIKSNDTTAKIVELSDNDADILRQYLTDVIKIDGNNLQIVMDVGCSVIEEIRSRDK